MYNDVLSRMYNWKFNTAYSYAKTITEFPKEALQLLEELANDYENIGWVSGKGFDVLREKNFKVAQLLGYTFDDTADYWVKK